MTCPQTKMILRLVSGELPALEARELREHLDSCPSCHAAWAEFQEAWQILGAWDVSALESDLASDVIRAADMEGSRDGLSGGQIHRWSRILRTAASIALAAGLGIATGYLVPMQTDRTAQTTSPTVEADEVLGALGLAELGTDSATGLSLGLGAPETLQDEEASS